MALTHLEYAIPLIFLAAIVRAYTGFGFAALAVLGLNLFWPPQLSVPLVLLLDLICGIGLAPAAWRMVDRPQLKRLLSGALLGAPLGLTALIWLPAELIKLATSLVVLLMCLQLLRQPAVQTTPRAPASNRLMGMLSGALTAATSTGGPPLVAYLMGSPIPPAQQRALLVLFFIVSSLFSLLLMLGSGIASSHLLQPLLVLLLPALAGIWLGNYLFQQRPPRSFRPLVLPLLSVLALLSLVMNLNFSQLTSIPQISSGPVSPALWSS